MAEEQDRAALHQTEQQREHKLNALIVVNKKIYKLKTRQMHANNRKTTYRH